MWARVLAVSLGEDFAVSRLRTWCAAILAGAAALAGCGGGGDGGSGGGTPPPPAPPTRLVLIANSDVSENTVSIYTLDATSGALSRHPASPFSGGLGLSPSSIAVTPSGRFAYITNAGTNDVSALAVNPVNAEITAAANPPYPVTATPQFVAVEPTGRFAYVALSLNRVEAYAINAGTGTLTAIAAGAGEALGTSPRHIAIDPSGRFAYVANGSSNNITFYTIDQTTGALTLPQVLPIAFTPPNAPLPVSIAVDPLGRFAYVTNSGTNDVSAFRLDSATGALSEIAGSPIAVSGGPTSVALEPTGRFAYVANLTGSTISILAIDQVTGLPALNDTVQLTASSGPRSLTVDPSGKFLYVTLSSAHVVEAFRIDPMTGALASVIGSPFLTGFSPLGVIATGPIQ